MLLIDKLEKLPAEYLNTPIQKLIEYHNFKKQHEEYNQPKLLIGTCMDYRVNLKIPDKFAFIIRNGGASLRHNDFQIAFGLTVGGCEAIAVIGHTDCGMANLQQKQSTFVDKFVNKLNYEEKIAKDFFLTKSPENEIYNEIDFTKQQVSELSEKYPNITVIGLIYEVKDNLLYLI